MVLASQQLIQKGDLSKLKRKFLLNHLQYIHVQVFQVNHFLQLFLDVLVVQVNHLLQVDLVLLAYPWHLQVLFLQQLLFLLEVLQVPLDLVLQVSQVIHPLLQDYLEQPSLLLEGQVGLEALELQVFPLNQANLVAQCFQAFLLYLFHPFYL